MNTTTHSPPPVSVSRLLELCRNSKLDSSSVSRLVKLRLYPRPIGKSLQAALKLRDSDLDSHRRLKCLRKSPTLVTQGQTKKVAVAPTPVSKKQCMTRTPAKASVHTDEATIMSLLCGPDSPLAIPKSTSFETLFPGTTLPHVTYRSGTPLIDRSLFSAFLLSLIKRAHKHLKSHGIRLARLPSEFVQRMTHAIQNALRVSFPFRSPRAQKKPAPLPTRARKSTPAPRKPTRNVEFVPATAPDGLSLVSKPVLTHSSLSLPDVAPAVSDQTYQRLRGQIHQLDKILTSPPLRSDVLPLILETFKPGFKFWVCDQSTHVHPNQYAADSCDTRSLTVTENSLIDSESPAPVTKMFVLPRQVHAQIVRLRDSLRLKASRFSPDSFEPLEASDVSDPTPAAPAPVAPAFPPSSSCGCRTIPKTLDVFPCKVHSNVDHAEIFSLLNPPEEEDSDTD
jgi:hypothetical protein